jgi:hypothetical protein
MTVIISFSDAADDGPCASSNLRLIEFMNQTITLFSALFNTAPFTVTLVLFNTAFLQFLMDTPTARHLVYHLSERVTVSGPAVEASIVMVTFYDGPVLMETFSLVDRWPEMERRLRRAIDRYKGRIDTVRVVVRADRDIVGDFTQVTMADKTAYKITKAGVDRRFIVFAVDCTPHAANLPSVYTAADLDNAINKGDLSLVKSIVESGVGVNTCGANGPVARIAMYAGWSAMLAAMNSTSGATVSTRCAVWDWLKVRPGINWHSGVDHRPTLLMSTLTVNIQLVKDLPWASINVHHQNTVGDTVLHLYMRWIATEESTGQQDSDIMDCVRLLLQHGSGTLTLSVNHNGRHARNIWDNQAVGKELLRVERETMSMMRSLLWRCLAVHDLVTIVTDYAFGTIF